MLHQLSSEEVIREHEKHLALTENRLTEPERQFFLVFL